MPKKRKTRAQLVGTFIYNCVYSLIWIAFCVMASDRHQLQGGGGRGIGSELKLVSPTYAWVQGGIVTLFCLLALYFLWRNWWRDIQRG